ncbi:MAG TPA: hypothetical protein VJT80_11895 [Steroidobacteraceae bacterium]|nr:hypothetical protein [Steroidobacteraceae bacterium]
MASARLGLAAFALALPGMLLAAEDPFVAVPSGTTQTLALQADGAYATRIGVVTREAGPRLPGLAFKVFEVQYKESRSNELLSRFVVTPQPATSTQADALVIDVPANSEELLPGNYVLTLQVQPAAAAGKPQSLALTLAKPAAALTAGSSVLVERIDNWWDPATIVTGKVRLTEDSRVANLTGLTFASDLERKAGTPAPGGTLVVCPGTSRLAAGESVECEVSLSGNFPYGTHTGKITVRSPQLAAPLAMNVTVLSRQDPRWLVVLALLGAVLGYFARVHFKRRKELAEAEITASLARQKLGLSRERIEDPEVRKKLDAEIATLDSTVARRKATEIVTAASSALTALQSIEKEFNDRRAVFEPEVKKVDALLAKSFVLPAPVQRAFAPVAARCEHVVAAFRHNNLVEASERLKRLNRESLLAVVTESIRWRESFVEYLAVLDRPLAPLGDEARNRLHAGAEAIRAMPVANSLPTGADIASADAELELTHRAFNGGKKIVSNCADGLDDLLDRAREKGLQLPVGRLIEDHTRSLQANLRAPLDEQLDERARAASEQLELLADYWERSLMGFVPAAQRAAIEQQAKAGHWDSAIDAAAAAIHPPPRAKEIPSSGATFINESLDTSRDRRATGGFDSAELDQRPAAQPSGLRPFTLTGTESERGRLRLETFWLEIGQTAIVAALFIFGVYAMNYDTWIGTLKDMFTIFALAFVTDLTADGALSALKK